MDEMNKALDWDNEIQNDGQEFLTLTEGDYNFTVTDFERGHFPGSAKIPSCPKGTLTLRIDTDGGVATCRTDLILASNMEWKIASFFRSIGQKKKGQPFRPNWSRLIGEKGRAHFKPREYVKDGETRQANDVDYFIDYDEKFFRDENTDEDGFMKIPDGVQDELPFV